MRDGRSESNASAVTNVAKKGNAALSQQERFPNFQVYWHHLLNVFLISVVSF
jgi:hypothetical protein